MLVNCKRKALFLEFKQDSGYNLQEEMWMSWCLGIVGWKWQLELQEDWDIFMKIAE